MHQTTTPPPKTREDVLRAKERLRRAYLLLEAHARRCTVEEAPAHDLALRQALGMVADEVERVRISEY